MKIKLTKEAVRLVEIVAGTIMYRTINDNPDSEPFSFTSTCECARHEPELLDKALKLLITKRLLQLTVEHHSGGVIGCTF